MPYIGNQAATQFTSLAKQTVTGDGTTGPYTLDHAVANAQEIEVFVNNVRQEPGVAYTVAGDQMTMTGNVASTDSFYVVFQGKALQSVVPQDDTVTTAKIQDDAVTSAKLDTNIDIAGTLDVTGALTADTGIKLGSGTDTLSVYDEGTFNPVMGASSGSITTQSGTGEYVRIGNLCFIYMVLTVTNKGTASGTVTVSGLPFASGTLRSPMISRENAQTGVLEQFVVDQENTTGFLKATGGGNVTLQSGNVRLIAGCYIVG